MATRSGVARMHDGKIHDLQSARPAGAATQFSTRWRMRAGAFWLATARRAWACCAARSFRIVVPGGPLLVDFVVTLCQGARRRDLGRHLREGAVARQGR